MKNQQLDGYANKWKALTIGHRVIILTTVVGLSVGGYIAYGKATATKYSVLFANLDDKTASDVLAKLDAKGIPHELEANGTRILVPTDQLASSRLELASVGVTGQAVPKGFDEIFSNQGLASSDFEQRVNYERALEGELARTLLAMEPVAGASVQLSIPQQSIFIGDGSTPGEKPTASVMLSLKRPLTAAETSTVANMIASSVEGLTPQQVTIASSDGTLLQAAGEDTSAGGSGATAKNLQVTRDYETTMADRLTQLARTISGEPGATVQVRAVLDFTQSSTEHETIDPTKNTPTADHTTTESWSGTGSTAGGTTGSSGGPIGAGTNGGNGTYSKSDHTTTFTPGDRTITKSTQTSPTVTKLSIAVVVPVATASPNAAAAAAAVAAAAAATSATATTVAGATATTTAATTTPTTTLATSTVDSAMLSRLIGSAAGIDATRGDTIEVAIVPAVATDTGALITNQSLQPATPPVKPLTTVYAEAAGGGAVAMLLLVMIMRRRRKKKEKLQALINGDATGRKGNKKKGSKKDGAADPTDVMPVVPGRMTPVADTDPDRVAVDEIKGDLEKMLAESPESLAALLSSWMAK